MSLKTTLGQTHKSAGNKSQGSILEDAPLFAQLDDFVLIQSERMTTKTTEAGKQKQKKEKDKKNKTKKNNKTKSAVSISQPVTKVPKVVAIDHDAVLLSVAETCVLLKISRATLVRMDKSGILPGRIKMGGSVRFHRETIVNWLQSLIATQQTPK
jgi:excisionase family DNA binding protein